MAKLELRHAELNEKYRKDWNVGVHEDDYCYLFVGGKQQSYVLYRMGGLCNKKDLEKPYFLILKYYEELYKDSITKDKAGKKHLAGHWVIIDQEGEEKCLFDQFTNVYLQGGLLYVINNKYYNIETGECYGTGYTSIDSDEFLFIDNAYDKDKSKRGILKISKIDGSTEVFPKK